MAKELFKNRVLISTGALLHDIGKFELRILSEEEAKKYFSQVGKEIDYKEIFKYAHAYLTKKFFEEIGIKDEFIIASAYHHKPENAKNKKIAYLYQLADQASSKERSQHVKGESFQELNYLRPVFQNISFLKEAREDKYCYDLKALSFEKEKIFPMLLNEISENSIESKYKKLFKNFKSEFAKIEFQNFTEKELTKLYFLCYKYLWCVPASTYDKGRGEAHYPDISLFDHARTTSAIATSLYTSYNLDNLQSPRLLLIKGDISGIQKFLYGISGQKYVAKMLRGRSIFLALLPELIALYILHKLNYPFTNLLFAGGGHFELLIGYEEGIEKALENIEREVEEILIENFYGTLGLVLGYVEITLDELKNYSKAIQKLQEEIELKKKRKFVKFLKDVEEFEEKLNEDYKDPSGSYIVCPSCRVAIVEEKAGEEEKNFCKWCKTFAETGGIIPRTKFIIFSNKRLSDLRGFYLERIGGVYFAKEVSEISENDGLVFLINETDFLKKRADGFKFVAMSMPRKESEGTQREEIMTFEDICELAEGDNKLSFARADVDNLGLIFRIGLGEDYSISRVATLSRSLDLFFSGYLNELFEKEFFKNTIYTLYAGGDDLFIIGPWDKVLKAILEIKKEFKEYICKNESFGLSAGIFTARHSYPMRFAGEEAGEAEDKAKERKRKEGKPFVCALDEVLSWEDFEEAMKEGDRIKELAEAYRALFYKFYLLLREYRNAEKKNSEFKYRFYPMFYYYLYRNVKDEDKQKEIMEYLIEVDKDYKVREDALFRAKYVLMKTRKR